MPKKKISAYKKGKGLEDRVAAWLRRTHEYDTKKRELVRGRIVKRPYEVDVHAWKKTLFGIGMERHLWVECKALKVKRLHVTKLVESARDVRDAEDDGIEEWKADLLVIASNVGFDIDAVQMADKYDIYCVMVGDRSYEFVGNMSKENFENVDDSDY